MFQDGRAREAAEWYVSLVPGSSIERVVDNDAGGATVYFTLADQGIEPERPPYQVQEGGSRLCFVRDPDGYRIELIERE